MSIHFFNEFHRNILIVSFFSTIFIDLFVHLFKLAVETLKSFLILIRRFFTLYREEKSCTVASLAFFTIARIQTHTFSPSTLWAQIQILIKYPSYTYIRIFNAGACVPFPFHVVKVPSCIVCALWMCEFVVNGKLYVLFLGWIYRYFHFV